MLVGLAGAGGYLVAGRPALVPPPQALSVTPVTPVATAVPTPPPRPALPPLLSEGDILDRSPGVTEVYRFVSQPDIVVIQFATLAEQARTLNRVAALIEKAGFPRERVLPDAELERAIRAGGEAPDTFYLGHDYRSRDLDRFFALAAQDGVALTPQELWLRSASASWGWPAGGGALITLVRETPAAGIDRPARATILRHELSHGAYFTQAGYAALARRFWAEAMTPEERAAMRLFLSGEGYDVTLDELTVNEAQAYLVHTADRRFFAPERAGLSVRRWEALRAWFLAALPPGWLRDRTPATLHVVAAP